MGQCMCVNVWACKGILCKYMYVYMDKNVNVVPSFGDSLELRHERSRLRSSFSLNLIFKR